jgi:hypothetical protein
MVNGGNLLQALEAVFELQTTRSLILVGLHLTPEEVSVLRFHLEGSDPPLGAVGRYKNVPVYLTSAPPEELTTDGIVRTEIHGGILYSFVQMLVVN